MGFGRVVIAAFCVVALGGETMASNAGKNGRARTLAAPEVGEALHNGTGNLSKLHRDELVRKLGAIKSFLEASKATDTNVVQLLRFAAEVEKEVRAKKYGLVFEEHKERVDVELEYNLPVLTEDKKRFIDNGGEVNFLIEGDNLAALKLLEKTHRGRIDLVYIDPPYNTGNKDFVYNDSYVDATDTFRHSKWLSFMKKRLEIARRLLSEEGVIFVSIDDNEQAQLRCMMDSIFGESNFTGNIIWQSATDNNPRQISTEHEYVVCYCRNKSSQGKWLIHSEKADLIKKKYLELKGCCKANEEIQKKLRAWIKQNKEALKGVAHYNNVDDKGVYSSSSNSSNTKPGGYTFDILHPITHKPCVKPAFGWRWTEATFWGYAKNGDVEWGKDETTQPHIKKRIETVDEQFKSIYYEDGRAATTMLEDLMGGKKVFNNPKPVNLISRIVEFAAKGNATILDFFAGSGTTGHAVMKLNANDGMSHRKFILVTNNENGICEKVTYERLKRVIEKENYAARLKYYKIGYVPIDEKVYYEYANDLLKHIRELVELENAVDFSKDKTVAIALTDKELEKFVGNDKRLEACKAVYVGHDVLIGSAIKATLKKHGVKVNIIPQYYYPELEG